LVETVGIARPGDFEASVRNDITNERQVVVFAAGEGPSLWEMPITENAVLVFGSEGRGVSEGVLNSAAQRCHIPLLERVDSLNVGVTASIVIFEIVRRRVMEQS
jgi:tRNA G18 (ribose-2'-O)-methylase SpoU